MNLDRTVKISDLLTSAALLLSALTLAISWSKDRTLETRRDADQVRAAAARCVAKLDRWQVIQLATFDELQPAYVEASERVEADPKQLGAARDFLWKSITIARARAKSKVSDEQIETAYAELLASYPPIRGHFSAGLRQLRDAEQRSLDRLLESTQSAVLNVELAEYSPPVLGNALRDVAARTQTDFVKETSDILTNVQNRFFALIERSDTDLISGREHGGAR